MYRMSPCHRRSSDRHTSTQAQSALASPTSSRGGSTRGSADVQLVLRRARGRRDLAQIQNLISRRRPRPWLGLHRRELRTPHTTAATAASHSRCNPFHNCKSCTGCRHPRRRSNRRGNARRNCCRCGRSLGSLRRAAPRAVRAVGESGREGMEVSCERCAVHGAARCGWICGSRKPRRGRRGKGPCEGTGSGRRGARAVFVGALRLELIGPRSTARPALLRCEPPPSPGRVRGVRACKDAAARRRAGRGASCEAVQNCNRVSARALDGRSSGGAIARAGWCDVTVAIANQSLEPPLETAAGIGSRRLRLS